MRDISIFLYLCFMKQEYKFYYLSDPRDKHFNPRYIGITSLTIEERLKAHLYTSKSIIYRHSMAWIRSLKKDDIIPNTTQFDVMFCTLEEAKVKENWYVLELLNQGFKLTNCVKENIGSTKNLGKWEKIAPILAINRYTNKIHKEYKNSQECCKDLNLSSGFVSNCLTGRKKTTQDYVLVRKNEYDELKDYTVPDFNCAEHHKNTYEQRRQKLIDGCRVKNSRKILQYDLNMNLITEWFSQTEAAEKLNLQQGNITKVCKGDRKQTGGFIFKYID